MNKKKSISGKLRNIFAIEQQISLSQLQSQNMSVILQTTTPSSLHFLKKSEMLKEKSDFYNEN